MSHYQSRVAVTRSSNGTVAKSSQPATPSSSSASSEVKPAIPKPESAWNAVHPQLSFQFGSIGASTGIYVQIPARTSSAPPNLDEQKQDLLRFEAVKPPAKVPIPVVSNVNGQKQNVLHFEGRKVSIPSGAQQQAPRSQVPKSGGPQQLQQQPHYRSQPQQSVAMSAGIPPPPYHTQGQQLPMPVQVTQPNSHLQASSVVTTQAHLPMPAPHLIPSQPQQQGLVQLPYSQHTLQPQLQHNGTGQVLQYPQSMAGPPLMGPPLAPLPGRMQATTMTQISHQLPGGLTPGMPVAPYGVMPVPSSFIPPRTSSAVKIVHPETRQEIKFDYKNTKPDTFSEGAHQYGGVQQQVSKSHAQESGGWQQPQTQQHPKQQPQQHPKQQPQQQPSLRPQSPECAPTSAGIPQPPHHQEGQQESMPIQVTPSKKKKLKNLLAKADAAGTNAYKAPEEEEIIELVPSKVGMDKVASIDLAEEEVTLNETAVSKDEPVPSEFGTTKAPTDIFVEQEATPNNTSMPKDELVPSEAVTAIVSADNLVKQVTPKETASIKDELMPLKPGMTDIFIDDHVEQEVIPNNKAAVMKKVDDVEDAANQPTSKELPEGSGDTKAAQLGISNVLPDVGGGVKTGGNCFVPEREVEEVHTKHFLLTSEEESVDHLSKADAAGTAADSFNTDKAPNKTELDKLAPSEVGMTNVPAEASVKQEAIPDEIPVAKEVDDREAAVELPTPTVSTLEAVCSAETGETHVTEKKGGETYTRDFLLSFKESNVELPLNFEVRPGIADLLSNPEAAFAHVADRDMHSGRLLDRQLSGGPRWTAGNFDDDRWARQGLHSPLWLENHIDMAPGGFRPWNAQGLLPRMPPNIRPGIAVPPLVPGSIPGRPLTPGTAPGLFRGNSNESDRWQKMPTGQKGLIPSPLPSLPPVHKAEKRYEVGKTSDEEQLKQRQIKGILNKLTPQNFQKLFEQVKAINIQSAITLTGVISQIYDKALTEPTFCEMYATFCKQLATDMPEFLEDGEKVTFKRVLLNKCQEEFHRGEREQAEAEEDSNDKLGAEEREEKRVKAKRRMLGNIRFIGELYKKHMLTERIMHECIRKLLGDFENPEEEDVEALCKLMSTIGHMIDQPMTREHVDAYLERITRLSNNQKLSSRIRFMLKDVIDLRRNGWQERRKVEGPKKIEQVHRDAVQERQATVAQAGRLSRGPSLGAASGRRLVPPPELNTQGRPRSPMFPPTTPMGSGRGARGPLVQDVRMEDKLLLDGRPSAIPMSQRLVDEGDHEF